MSSYFAVIHKEATSAFGISWPDLPGCVSATDLLEEVDAMARDALSLHLEGLQEDGMSLPTPSSFSQVYEAHKNDADFLGVILITVPKTIKRRRVQLRVADVDLQLIDYAAATRGMDRTAFMVTAAKQFARQN